MSRVYSVAIIGCGSRGIDAYGKPISNLKDKYRIVSVCDTLEIRRKIATELFSLNENNVFSSEEEFFKERRADVLVIATQDKDHVRMCIKALQLGYDVLLEKPISPNKNELLSLLDAHKTYGGKVAVCHVLRYAPLFAKVKSLLSSEAIGKLIRIESIEQVAYWHQAHSYVRGNWRREKDTSPMIMAKCCHDLDLLTWYVDSACESVYSVGDLKFFKKENQPSGASDRCQHCKYKYDCAYSAEVLYVERWKKSGSPKSSWPYNVVDKGYPNTEDSLRKAYENGPYGRCVFACDNDVVDNQTVVLNFKNGVSANLTMTAFTARGGRIMTFHGTAGELLLEDDKETLTLSVFGKEPIVYNAKELLAELDDTGFSGHGGGDGALIRYFYDVLEGNKKEQTTLSASVESHLMAIAAEKSRKSGKVEKVH